MRLTTERLELADVTTKDHDALLEVALSNPCFLATHEGTGGTAGGYDRSMLERDLAVAELDPLRCPLVVRLRENGQVVGRAEVLTEHPRDHLPWIGLVEPHADHQGQGYGAEATRSLLDWARGNGVGAVRLGVDDGNDKAYAFWTRQGFTRVDRRTRTSPAGDLGVTVLERRLGAVDDVRSANEQLVGWGANKTRRQPAAPRRSGR